MILIFKFGVSLEEFLMMASIDIVGQLKSMQIFIIMFLQYF